MKKFFQILSISLFIIALIWVVDSFLDTFLYNKGNFFHNLLHSTSRSDLHRLLISIVLIILIAIILSILDRKGKTFKKLNQMTELFSSALTNANYSIWKYNSDMNEFNIEGDVLKDIFPKLRKNKVSYIKFKSLLFDNDRDKLAEIFENRSKHQIISINVEFDIKTEDSCRRLAMRGKLNYFDNQIDGIGIFLDLTERARFELENVRQKKELQTILNTVPAYIYYKDLNRRYISVNKAFCEASGIELYKWIGKRTDELFTNLEVNIDDMDKRVIEEGVHIKNQIDNFIDVNGNLRWLETEKLPYLDESGKIIGLIGLSIDITEKIISEYELKDREAKLHAVFNNNSIGIALLRRNGNIFQTNDYLCDFLGYSREELLELKTEDISYPEDIIKTLELVMEVTSTEIKSKSIEKRYVTKDGIIKWAELSISLVPQDKGKDLLIAIVVDINERLRAEEELRQSEERLALAFSSSNEGLIDINLITEQVYFSPRYFTMLGYDPNEMVQDKSVWEDILHPDDIDYMNKSIDSLILKNSKHIKEIEVRFKSRSGLWHWILHRMRIVEWDIEGMPKRIIGTNIDITDIKLIQEELKIKEKQMRQVIQNMPVMMMAFNESNQILVWNRECVNVTGYRVRDIVDNPRALDILFPDKMYRLKILNSITDPANNLLNFEIKIVCKDSSEKILSWSNISEIYPISGWKSWSVALDMTERLNIEHEINEDREKLARYVDERTYKLKQLNIELENALKSKDEFLSTMSHELRTPLNAILGLSESMLEDLGPTASDLQIVALRTIDSSGKHLLSLINDILDISKIGASKLDLIIEPVQVDLVCQSGLQFVMQMAKEKNIKIEYKIDPDIHSIKADHRRLKQIIVNLLSNAIKFTPDGKKVGLKVCGDIEKEIISFLVWDQGIGIPEEKIEKLFEPFVQLDSSFSRKFEGTGLGLALVKRLTELHDGVVNVRSIVNEGSEFEIVLPWQRVDAAKQKIDEVIVDSGQEIDTVDLFVKKFNRNPLIMIAEDDKNNVQLLELYLTKRGFDIILMRNGEEVLNFFNNNDYQPDIILMDILMPKKNGFETIVRIRQFDKQIPIIAVTALAMEEDKNKCLSVGANDYISKPVSLIRLSKMIDKYILKV